MASAPLRRCNEPGCNALQRSGRCERHRKKQRARHDRERPHAAARGYDHRWRRDSKTFLAKHPWCRECDSKGKLKAAACVDHIEPHRGNQELFWDVRNWQPLCLDCHNDKTGSGE